MPRSAVALAPGRLSFLGGDLERDLEREGSRGGLRRAYAFGVLLSLAAFEARDAAVSRFLFAEARASMVGVAPLVAIFDDLN